MNTHARCFIICLALVTSVLLGCTKRRSTSDYGLPLNETLRINLEQEPPSLDWSKSSDTTSSLVENNIMEGLVTYDLNSPDLKLVGALATEWRSSKDAATWTFKLRSGVKWTDGVEFTGKHVMDGWERLLRPSTASEYAYFLFDVKNARKYNTGELKDFSQVGIRMNEAGELVVELEQAMSYFPMLLTHHATFPIRLDVTEKYGDRWTDPENIVTLGAYRLTIWDHDKSLVLERNKNYYGEKAKIKYILGFMINEYSTALSLFDTGKLDFQQSLPSKELPILRKIDGYVQHEILSMYYYGLNTRKPPFNNLKVRKAFAMAIDKKQVTDLMASGFAPLSGWIPRGLPGNDPDIGLKFDPVAARKLLDETPYKDRSKFPRVNLAFNTNENHQRIAENVQAQIKKNLGIQVQVQNEEWKVYLDRLRSDTPDIYRMGWIGDYPDASTFISLMTSFSENNHTGWGNKTYDALAVEGTKSLDPEVRKQVYAKAQRLLTEEDVPVIPIYSGVRQMLVSKRLKNFPKSALERYEFKNVSFQ